MRRDAQETQRSESLVPLWLAGTTFVMNPDGTGRAYGLTSTWSLSGSTLTLDLRSLGVITSSVSIEPATAGSPQRLRLRQLTRVVGGVRNLDEDGVELVILDMAT